MAPAPNATHSQRNLGEGVGEESELDLLAGLWQEAPFARLPADAPTELHDLVVDIDDPRRVYAIHRASRRHGFQTLTDKFIFQLRNGCGAPDCTVSTCFTCRKRLAGKAPIRRYSPLSARTLAVYLASQDNPEQALCPTLRPPKEASKAVLNNLIFETTRRDPMLSIEPKRSKNHGSPSSPKHKPNLQARQAHSSGSRRSEDGSPRSNNKGQPRRESSSRSRSSPGAEARESAASKYTYKIREQPANKDHRSFAANLFGTVAFRMLEWLTPQGMAAIRDKLDVSDLEADQTRTAEPDLSGSSSTSPKTESATDLTSPSKSPSVLNGEPPEKLAPPEPLNPSPRDPTKSRRSPEATFRSPQSSKPRRRASLEPPSPAKVEEPKSPTKSPRLNGFHPEKLARPLKSTAATISRGIPEIPAKPAFFGNVSPQHAVVVDSTSEESSVQYERGEPLPADPVDSMPITKVEEPDKQKEDKTTVDSITKPIECPLPQSLKGIDADVVDFICDVFDEDGTGETPIHVDRDPHESYPQPLRGCPPLTRKKRAHDVTSRRQWKAFNEQTLFSVLSSPRSLIASFMAEDDLLDSHTLWYCMFRLTRAAPSLVFHSLWMAADSLFVPPRALQEGNSKASKLFRRNRDALSDFEAGCLMSICLHALAGSAPICPDKHSLRALTWVRSTGLTLSTFADALNQPAALREQFDDAFSNDLAVRLARRLCCAITARRRFATMLEADQSFDNTQDGANIDVLDPESDRTDILDGLFNQIDVLGLETTPVLEFSESSRVVHHGRMQILTMEWARAVIFNSWDGKPDFSTNGPFAGALLLVQSMYDQREFLELVDGDFQMEYFSDRLDSMDVPIAWLAFNSTNQRRHLLDYPYLFAANTRVSFFRSINFARMSRTFEESSSLNKRIEAIVERGSLIKNPHHKVVLQDLLKKASSRYLILEISRDNVVRDAFDQLWQREERELLRPLKVHLGEEGGEEGFDSGGVQQEFFRMAMAEFLDPHYGAFVVDDRTRMAWFAPSSIVELWKYELLGLLASLALFNGLTLPVTFPKALYHKLLDWPVTELDHIEDGWPDLASGLTMLQEWDEKDGAVEDVFARTYEFSVSAYGSHITRDMRADSPWPQMSKEGLSFGDSGEEAPLVTRENRDEYVTDYIRYLTDISVRPQFTAFQRGFQRCLEQKSLTLLTPTILQSLVEGVQEVDMAELQRYTRYVGWDSSHRTIKDFWSIVKRYDEAMKRRLIEFVTASDRLPVGGVRNLQFVVQKNGEEDEGGHLPTAYTCYGTLLLPEYKDKEVLRERLAMALDNAQGFGFA